MDDEIAEVIVILFLFWMAIVLIIVAPFFTVWSLNHLFGTEIEMTFKTWCAVVWLMTILRGINLAVKKQQ